MWNHFIIVFLFSEYFAALWSFYDWCCFSVQSKSFHLISTLMVRFSTPICFLIESQNNKFLFFFSRLGVWIFVPLYSSTLTKGFQKILFLNLKEMLLIATDAPDSQFLSTSINYIIDNLYNLNDVSTCCWHALSMHIEFNCMQVVKQAK